MATLGGLAAVMAVTSVTMLGVAHYRATYPGPPPPGFRAVLGIFRGGPIRRSSSALQKLIGINKVSLYVNYVRRAAVINGTTYYVYVS